MKVRVTLETPIYLVLLQQLTEKPPYFYEDFSSSIYV